MSFERRIGLERSLTWPTAVAAIREDNPALASELARLNASAVVFDTLHAALLADVRAEKDRLATLHRESVR